MAATIWTIGHSTRDLQSFLVLLQDRGVRRLLDVRRFPYSRRHPQFHTDPLAERLRDQAIDYRHLPALGGRRTPRADSVNTGWRHRGFRGYADYMQTEEFQGALDELMRLAKGEPSAVMCAEAVPWRCHRSLIADALVVHGWRVEHILGPSRTEPHRLTAFAREEGGRLLYPAQGAEIELKLF
ncbi:DUF488 domain-containing protein [Candidatus Nitrospira bockiana]